MKQVIAWFLVFMILFSSASLLRDPGQQEWENPYIDVTQDMWSYQYITELNKAGVLPSGDNFHGQEEETRGNLVLYLYNMDNGVFADRKKQREKEQGKPQADPASFSDVAEDNPYYDAVYWAYGNGLVGGTTDTEFSPDHSLTREQVCTILARFAALEGISLRLEEELGPVTVVLTGGHGRDILPLLRRAVEYEPHLQLMGLRELWLRSL